jgi:transcriptional regulator with XRE-family HTH domain/tetratricopeptide (TPR) repeat protein
MSVFGVTLRQFRLAAGLTQEELAEHSGVSVRAIGYLENGQTRRPNRRTAMLLAKALDLDDLAADQLVQAARLCVPVRAEADEAEDQAARRAQVAGESAIVPRQLPAALAQFAGRTAELNTLDHCLEQASGAGADGAVVISAIGGMPGVGKTALALRWAHRVSWRFPDGQLYVNMRGYDPSGPSVDAAEVICRFLEALGVTPDRFPADRDGQAGLYRSLLAGRRMLIVIDNAQDAVQVRPLLPGTPGCLVLVTTRSPLVGLAVGGAQVLPLDVLTESEAAELLSARLGAGRVAAEPQAVAALVRLCARLPLALAVVAARAAASGWPLAALAAELADARGRLGALSTGDAASDVQAVFSWSYSQLSAAAARVFPLLGVHPGPDVSEAAVASLAGLPVSQAQAALRELVGVGLITEHVPARYVLHDLLRAYATDQARACESSSDRRAATRRMMDHYLHTAAAAARTLRSAQDLPTLAPPSLGVSLEHIIGGRQAQGWFDAEHKTLLALTRQAASEGFENHALLIPWTLVTVLERDGHWHDLASVQHHWHDLVSSLHIALACAERLDDLAGVARTNIHLGRVRHRLGQTDLARAHLARAAELSRRLNDPAAEARAHLALAVVVQCELQLSESLALCLRGLELAEAAGDLSLQAVACNNAGYTHAMLGDLVPGLNYCLRSLDLLRQVGDPYLEAGTLDSLGYIYHQQGGHDQAATSFLRAVALFRQLGDRLPAARSLSQLGDAYHALGANIAAQNARQQALSILGGLAHPEATAIRDRLRS